MRCAHRRFQQTRCAQSSLWTRDALDGYQRLSLPYQRLSLPDPPTNCRLPSWNSPGNSNTFGSRPPAEKISPRQCVCFPRDAILAHPTMTEGLGSLRFAQNIGVSMLGHRKSQPLSPSMANRNRTEYVRASPPFHGGNFVNQNGDAEETAPRVDTAHHLVEGPDDQTTGGDHLRHCRYGTGRMPEPEDRRRDEKDAECVVWCRPKSVAHGASKACCRPPALPLSFRLPVCTPSSPISTTICRNTQSRAGDA
jgi:hypothetical protein